jgi:hypothetical protein
MTPTVVIPPFNETVTKTLRLRPMAEVTRFGYALELLTEVALTVKSKAVAGYSIGAAAAAYAVTGNAAGMAKVASLLASVGTFAITANDASLSRVRSLAASTGVFTVTGIDAIMSTKLLSAAAGSFTVTGNAATLSRKDSNYSSVSLLLHMDGSNGSTTFTDNSSNAFTVTANGNAQVSTAQSKFGGASGLLDGSGDFLSIPDDADFDFGSGNFTIEMWVRFTSVPSSGQFVALYSHRDASNSINCISIWYSGTDSYFYASYSTDGTTQANAIFVTPSASAGTWIHLAMVRNGTSLDMFTDGTKNTTVNIGSITLFNSTAVVRIGAANSTPAFFLNGHIDEVRVTKGVARYTSNFTPSAFAFPDA